jgi:hypothetical protein
MTIFLTTGIDATMAFNAWHLEFENFLVPWVEFEHPYITAESTYHQG